ncbi:MAG: LLM class flavin-dependent oxidoreductase [Actinomycetota bacterium]
MPIRFCAYQYQNRPLPELDERWRRAGELGFDVLWNVDTVIDPDRARSTMFDGPATLTAMALRTQRIRIGTLVTSLDFRSPVTASKAAVTVDHLSNGRLELALGVGDPSAGEGPSGVSWSAGERVRRFDELADLLDRLLTNEVTTFDGEFYRCLEAETVPKMLEIAARRADARSSWGGYGIENEEQMFAVTRDRSLRLDDLCFAEGRDPTAMRRSLCVFAPLTPWESTEYFPDMVGWYGAIGIDEFVLYWPKTWRDAPHEDPVFERVCADVLPSLRGP